MMREDVPLPPSPSCIVRLDGLTPAQMWQHIEAKPFLHVPCLYGSVYPATALGMLLSDVRGFTTICESYKNDPQAVTSLINRLLTPLTNVIVNNEGTIDKYMGDAVMAFWNAPLEVPGHELKACAAALEMIDRLAALNRERQAEANAAGQPFLPMRIGIGINTGRALVGNLGSDLRFNYSVLGDPVNIAARLEGQTKFYGVPIIIGPKTGEKAKEKFAMHASEVACHKMSGN